MFKDCRKKQMYKYVPKIVEKTDGEICSKSCRKKQMEKYVQRSQEKQMQEDGNIFQRLQEKTDAEICCKNCGKKPDAEIRCKSF